MYPQPVDPFSSFIKCFKHSALLSLSLSLTRANPEEELINHVGKKEVDGTSKVTVDKAESH
jgi:hypothetical protein